MTLQEAIEREINLGENDPHVVAANVMRRYDDKWLAAELLKNAEAIVPSLAREIIGSRRRSSLAIAKLAAMDKREIMLQAAWLPGVGWVEFGKFTIEQWHALATRYRKGAAALNRYADWCEANVRVMKEQNVREYREVKGALPVLPAADDVVEVPAVAA